MPRPRKLILGMLFTVLLLAGRLGPNANAVTKPSGITISPAYQQISVPGDIEKQALSFTIKNDESAIQNLRLSSSDFNTLSDTGGLFFVGSNPTELQKKYGLIKWLGLPYSELSLQPGQTVTVHANIINQPSLSPGGHYGSINIAVENSLGSAVNNINVRPVASTLLFVTKLGGDTHKLSLFNVKIQRSLFSLPSTVTLKFHNDGNTHLIPRGIVTVKSPTGKLISQGVINRDSSIILPETSRLYSVPLQTLSSAAIAGKYELEVDFRFDGIDQVRAYQRSFVLVPLLPSVVALASLVIVVLGLWRIVWPYLRRRHKR